MINRQFVCCWLLLLAILDHGTGFGQVDLHQPVTLSYTEEPLANVFKQIRSELQVEFAYDVEAIRDVMITIDLHKVPLEIALNKILKHTTFTYMVTPDGILIAPGKLPRIDYSAYTFSIEGVVVDGSSGETLPFATVYLPFDSRGTTTNSDGRFSLNQVTDTTTMTIQYLGYHQHQREIGSGKKITISLKPMSQQLEEVTVTPQLQALEVRQLPGHAVFNPRLVTGLPNLGEVDVFRSLQLLPGISATDETSAGLVIRGGTPDQNLILFDGFAVFHIDHFFGVFSAFNHLAIKDIQVFKGGFDAVYGGRTSGVVDITGKHGNVHQVAANIGLNLISLNGAVEVPIGPKVTLLAAARRSFTDVIQTGLYNDLLDNVRNNGSTTQNRLGFNVSTLQPDFYFYDLNTKLTYRPTDQDMLSLSIYHGKDNLTLSQRLDSLFTTEDGVPVSLSYGINDPASWGNTGGSLRWGRQWGTRWYSQLQASYSEYSSRSEQNSTFSFVASQFAETFQSNQLLFNEVSDLQFKADVEWTGNKKIQVLFGAGVERNNSILDVAISTDEDTIQSTELNQTGILYSLYGQARYQPHPKWMLSGGLRFHHFSRIENSFWEPRLALTFKPTPQWSIKGSFGRYNQFLNRVINNDINNGLPDFWVLSGFEEGEEGDIPHQSGTHWLGGVNYQNNGWTIDVEAYYKKVDGLLDFVPLGRNFPTESIQGAEFVFGQGRTKGIDFLIEKSLKPYTGWAAYSLSRSTSQFDGLNDNQPFPSNQDQRHEFKTVHLYQWRKWQFSTVWIYGTGKRYTAPGVTHDLSGISGPVNVVEVGPVNGNQLPDYHRLDLSVGYNIPMGSWNCQLGLSVFNLYNRQNIKYRRFDFIRIGDEGDRLLDPPQVISFDVNMLGITPNIYLNFSL